MEIRDLPVIAKGRGAQINPNHRFARIQLEASWEQVDPDDVSLAPSGSRTEFYWDDTQSIVSENDSPDIPFRYSINPYRGCAHGCAYCYARPTHEYFNLSAGLDFEAKIFVKAGAAKLFRQWLARPTYEPATVVFSGVTDCYQPLERHLRITRQCLEVAREAGQPVSIITKNRLVTRDLDLLSDLARRDAARVAISVTTLEESLARSLEPRTSGPSGRLRAIRELTAAGIPVVVMVAPIIPGLNDHELPRILQQAREAGAIGAGYVLLRLPLTVEPIFLDWLSRHQSFAAEKVTGRLRAMRGGKLNDSRFGERMVGTGPLADHLRQTFQMFAKKYGLMTDLPPLSTAGFRRPLPRSGQGWLFEV